MNKRNSLNTLPRAGRILWKFYGLAWFAIIIPVLCYTGIALCLAVGTLYVLIFGPVAGTLLLVAAIVIALSRRRLARGIAKHLNHNLKLVAYEVCTSAGLLLAATLLHFPLSPLWYMLVSLLAGTLLEGCGKAWVEVGSHDNKPYVHVETWFWFWFVVAWVFVLIYEFHPDQISQNLTVAGLGLVAGSFVATVRKYILARLKTGSVQPGKVTSTSPPDK